MTRCRPQCSTSLGAQTSGREIAEVGESTALPRNHRVQHVHSLSPDACRLPVSFNFRVRVVTLLQREPRVPGVTAGWSGAAWLLLNDIGSSGRGCEGPDAARPLHQDIVGRTMRIPHRLSSSVSCSSRPSLLAVSDCRRSVTATSVAAAVAGAMISVAAVGAPLAPRTNATHVAADAWSDTSGIYLSEIRVDQPGSDLDEYFEIAGPSLASLDGLTYLVIGDGAGGSGVIEEVVSLDGFSLDFNGVLLFCESSFTLGPLGVIVSLNYENSDNLTHLLVSGFTGANGDDLDLDDDGMLDVTPWDAILDSVATVENIDTPPTGTEWWYGTPVGPVADGVGPFHILRCPDTNTWVIGPDDPAVGFDTPYAPNTKCAGLSGCGGDLDFDGEVGAEDLGLLIAAWGTNDTMADLDLNGIIDGADIGWLLSVWGPCE